MVGSTAAGCARASEPAPTPTTATPTSTTTPGTTTAGLSPQSFGAVGDGSTDDTAALQRALDALRPGQTLDIAAGKVYRHSDILTVERVLRRVDIQCEVDASSRKGFAFNCLTSYSDPPFMRDYLHYADPCFYFDLCKRTYSRQVSLLHDYGLYEFTLLVRKAS
ncbi:MAG: hypothetical protein EOO70_06815 [Myxococcaceae bacterium]|nr:MAG: hypothetical protein EOO70_06815 [Myxococcaceae bacterium]